MKALVLGGTGLIGNHVIRELLAQDCLVTSFSRGVTPQKNLEGLALKRIFGDVSDVSALSSAMQNQDYVFICSGYYPKKAFAPHEDFEISKAQTHAMLLAIQNANPKRVVYTSSLTTIGKAQEIANESLFDKYDFKIHPYFTIKKSMEMAFLNAAKTKKLPIVVVNPTACFGAYEMKPKRLCLIPQLVNQKLPFFCDAKMNVVSAKDVAKGHVLAAQNGKVAERYILGNQNQNLQDILYEICDLAMVKRPRFKMPLSFGIALAYASERVAQVLKTDPQVSLLGFRFLEHGQFYSSQKAKKELGYQPQSMAQCYLDAIAWYKKIGYC